MANLTIDDIHELYRPCIVENEKAIFHGWEYVSNIVGASICVGGHPGGQISETLAIIERENGTIERVYPEKVKFIDSERLFSKYDFSINTDGEIM